MKLIYTYPYYKEVTIKNNPSAFWWLRYDIEMCLVPKLDPNKMVTVDHICKRKSYFI